MKAIVYREYGPPAVLRLEEIEKPVPADDQVLLEVRAASVNPIDWHFLRGTPYFLRLMTGLRRPKVMGLGMDLAGRVESVGARVAQFRAGDEVFGWCRGAFAEYACASESALVMKPANLTFEQAASAPVAGLTAARALAGKRPVQPGQKVLINGAAGGVGTFAVQIARSLGAEVTGVCSTRNVDMVRSLGAGQVIDYTREDFAAGGRQYDRILDNVGNRSLSDFRRLLNPKGIYVQVGGPSGRWLKGMDRPIRARVLSLFVSQDMSALLARPSKERLTILRDLMQSGKVTPAIDRTYSLAEVPEAIRYLEEGHARGKVVIRVP